MEEEKFYIEVKHYGEAIRITTDNSDVTFEQLIEIFRKISVSMGYNIETIEEYFDQ